MGKVIDLHIHTNASSDGEHSPEEIFMMSRNIGLKAISFADHNSVDNIDVGVSLSDIYNIDFLPSIEINSNFKGSDIHILGYFIDYKDNEFKEWLDKVKEKKMKQAIGRIERLREIGFYIDYEDVKKFSNNKIPTGTAFLKAIISREENKNDLRIAPYIKGYKSKSPYLNFYIDYLKPGKSAFYPLDIEETPEIINIIKYFKGIPVLAHPSDMEEDDIIKLIKAGLKGIEVYSSYHDSNKIACFRELALRYNLLITAGSDFHGKGIKPDVNLGANGGDYMLVERLKEFK
jgi:hypothetical protein